MAELKAFLELEKLTFLTIDGTLLEMMLDVHFTMVTGPTVPGISLSPKINANEKG